jgi:topoisomerase IA-like protein
MQTIEGTIEQKRAQVSRLLDEIELLEKAKELLGTEPTKRKGRPKGSKNQAATVKTRAKKASKKAARKGSQRAGKKAAGTVATPEASS